MPRTEIRIAGFGGQGVVLAGVLLGTAATLKDNKHAIQTQSYGAAARGGAARSDVIISDENISVGVVPPKQGFGAITIEVKTGGSNEISKIKKEMAKYPGVSIKEKNVNIGDEQASQVSIINEINKTIDFYIILEKYNYTYFIKYSNESEDFINKVGASLQTFKFTK